MNFNVNLKKKVLFEIKTFKSKKKNKNQNQLPAMQHHIIVLNFLKTIIQR